METYIKPGTLLKGLPLSGGVACACVCRFNINRHSNLDIYKVQGDGVEYELGRIERAVKIVSSRLDLLKEETVRKIGPAEAGIFSIQKMILQDPDLQERISRIIHEEQTRAEAALMVALDSFETQIRELDNEYIKDRASDFGEVKRRMLDVLMNINPEFQCADEELCQRGQDRVVVAEELTPMLTIEIDSDHTLAFITEHGGANSHAAILARALGIPAVSGIKNAHQIIPCGTEVIVNGDKGEIIVQPDKNTVKNICRRKKNEVCIPKPVESVDGLEVMANISRADNVRDAAAMKADGIGLYRTEFEFMAAGKFLNENEQYKIYSRVVKGLKGRPVTFRMFDAGGDKPMGFLDIPAEENPALGWRGARLLLDNQKLMRTQARAIARTAKHGPVNVLYPMVTDIDQFRELKNMFVKSIADLPRGVIHHGVMFEVPSACLESEVIFAEADFGSIGTNDLIQYLFAIDRNNELIDRNDILEKPILWSLIGKLAADAEKTGKPLSVCGEIAGIPQYIEKLLNIGIKSVSVSPRLIPEVRKTALKNAEKLK